MRVNTVFSLLFVVILTTGLSYAQNESSKKIETTKLTDNLYKLKVENVNLIASIGPDGVLLSDAAEESMGKQVLTELKKLGTGQIKYIVNTHWHHDHTGGNKCFGSEAATIAHKNVREILSVDLELKFWEEQYTAFPKYALPDITFSDNMKIHFNGEEIELIHFPNGHTNGDIIVYFKKANVLHLGDLLFSDSFPAVDFENGGNVRQFASNLINIIDIMPSDVKIIAGHGRDYTIIELKKYSNMLLSTLGIVQKEMKNGKTLEEMKKAKILSDWEDWGNGFFTCDFWIELVYHSINNDLKQ